jgi:DNA-binding SARP family transcriptional activator/WD40 repeat protein
MRIAVLGPLEVRDDRGAPVEIPGAKERLLLAVLASDAGRVVSTDRITEALWNGDAPPSARKSLQAHLVRLRTALEPDRPRGSTGRYVVRRGAGYALALDREQLDALRFGELTALGRARLGSGDADDAVRVLTRAVDLWRGEPYADWPDADFATAERRRLTEVRASAVGALLEARLAAGQHAAVVPELERLVVEEPLREDWWRFLVLALYRSGRQADALAAGRRARAVLAEELGADPGPALREMESAVLAQDPGLDAPPPRAVRPAAVPPPLASTSARCPYLGLAAYQPADAGLFHGRRRLVDQLVARLVDLPFLVVSGLSGAGKSSVVRAGLVPALARGAVGGSEAWHPVVLTPGRTPVDALAPLTGEDPPEVPVLLVCDQTEELWAPGIDEAERRTFLDTVLGLLDDGIVARCVAVVRGDHVGRLAEHPGLVDRLAGALVLVPPLSDPELREVVQEPAAAVGLTVEPELLDAVVADVLGRAGALPLLSTALVGTWERRRGQVLTLAGYLEAGGVSGALARSAETAYGSLDAGGREAARRLLVRLADVDEQGALVRRRVPLAELDVDADPALRRVVETFVARRLLSVDGTSVEVTHEALLSAWPRLARWLEDDATGRSVRRHLAPTALEWEERGRPRDELYRGARLAGALDWAAGADADLSPVERHFLEAARTEAEAELRDARRRADREADGRRRTRRLAAGLAAGMVAALVATALAVRSSQDAQEASRDTRQASREADAGRLATLAATTDLADLSLLLAAEAVRLADLPETRSALLGAVVGYGRMVRVASVPGPVTGIVADADANVLVTQADDVYTWDEGSREPERVSRRQEWSGWFDQDASPTQPLVVGGGWWPGESLPSVRVRSADGEVRTLSSGSELDGVPLAVSFLEDGSGVVAVLEDPLPVVVLPGEPLPENPDPPAWRVVRLDMTDGARSETDIGGALEGEGALLVADIDERGRTAVVADLGSPPSAEIVDVLGGGRTPVRPPAQVGGTLGVRALPDGAAQMWTDGEVTLYGPGGRIRQGLDTGSGRVRDVVVSPDGSWAATVGAGGSIVLWDVDPQSGLWIFREELVGHAGDVSDAEVSADGDRLLTAGEDGRVVEWDARPDAGFGRAVPGLTNRVLTSPPAVVVPGRLVVAATMPADARAADPTGVDQVPVTATILDPTSGDVVAEIAAGTASPGADQPPVVSVSPDRRRIAVRSGTAMTVVDVATRRPVSRYAPQPAPAPDGTSLAVFDGCLAWSPDSSQVLVCTAETDGPAVTAVDARTGTEVRSTAMPFPLDVMAPSRDHRLVAAVYASEGVVLVLDARTLELRRTVTTDFADTPASHVSFAPDGSRIAVSGPGGLVLVDTRTWEEMPAPAPLTGLIRQAEWFDDSRTLAVVAEDGAVHLFDADQGLARRLPLPDTVGTSDADVSLLPGISDELVVLRGDGVGRRYPLDPATWSARACALAGRQLTEEEWASYLPGRPYEPLC